MATKKTTEQFYRLRSTDESQTYYEDYKTIEEAYDRKFNDKDSEKLKVQRVTIITIIEED